MRGRVAEGRGSVKARVATAHRFGRGAERGVLVWLLAQGWRPMARPPREKVQTDLLLRRGATLLLVEVKARRKPEPLEKLLSPTQRQRLARQAAWWAARHPTLTVRLDVVLLSPQWPWLRRYANVLAP